MLIKSLKYKNFRQFKGENKIIFSCDKEKNVTIILGNNTFGKTTLLQMFHWCLYNKTMFRAEDNPDFLLNLEVSENMYDGEKEEVIIEIILEHQNIEYTISRKQIYMKTNNIVSSFPSIFKIQYKDVKTGKTDFINEHDREEVINKILPEELAGYFLFDTERVQNIAERKDLSSAVKGLLGLSVIENAKKHLGSESDSRSVIGKWYVDLKENNDDKAKRCLELIQKRGEEIEENEKIKLETEDQIEIYERRKRELENKIQSLEEATNLQKEKERRERDIRLDEEELETDYIEYRRYFGDNIAFFFAQPLYKKAAQFLEEADVDDKGIKDITADSIKEIIANGKCLCGAQICKGNDAYLHLMEQIKFVPPESIGTTIANFKSEINLYNRQNNNDNFYKRLQGYLGKIHRLRERIYEGQERIEQIEKEIVGKENAGKYQIQCNDIKIKLKQLQEKKESCIAKIATATSEKERLTRLYDKESAKLEKNQEIRTYIAYARNIKLLFSTLNDAPSFRLNDAVFA